MEIDLDIECASIGAFEYGVELGVGRPQVAISGTQIEILGKFVAHPRHDVPRELSRLVIGGRSSRTLEDVDVDKAITNPNTEIRFDRNPKVNVIVDVSHYGEHEDSTPNTQPIVFGGGTSITSVHLYAKILVQSKPNRATEDVANIKVRLEIRRRARASDYPDPKESTCQD